MLRWVNIFFSRVFFPPFSPPLSLLQIYLEFIVYFFLQRIFYFFVIINLIMYYKFGEMVNIIIPTMKLGRTNWPVEIQSFGR